MQLKLELNLKTSSPELGDRATPKIKDCWQTPKQILNVVSRAFEERRIITDPCTVPHNPTNADIFYTPEDDGLAFINEWERNAYINPPYSDPSIWLNEIVDRLFLYQQIKEAIALVPTGCISTKRCRESVQKASAICHWEGRIAFIHPSTGRKAGNTNFTSCFLYYGQNIEQFLEEFSFFGIVTEIKQPPLQT